MMEEAGSSNPLLQKTREINHLLQDAEVVGYDDIATVLKNVLTANVYITSQKGKVLGYAFVDDFECSLMLDKVINRGEFPRHYVKWLLRIGETRANLRSKTGMCAYEDNTPCIFHGKNTTIVPIYGRGERIGTLIVAKYNDEFTEDDLLLAEYGATVVGMEMLHDHAKRMEDEARQKKLDAEKRLEERKAVKMALLTLSESEVLAAYSVLTALPGDNKPLVASKIADKVKVTRSVIVNALSKLSSARVISSRSMGMKGTKIDINNPYLMEGLQARRVMKDEDFINWI